MLAPYVSPRLLARSLQVLSREVPSLSSLSTAVYNPKAFIPHAASLRQAFAHCAIFLVAATRRCRLRISVTLWGVTLSRPLPVIALVGHYPTNKLIGRRLLLRWPVTAFFQLNVGVMRYYPRFLEAIPRQRVDSYALLTRLPLPACAGRSTCMPKARRQHSS